MYLIQNQHGRFIEFQLYWTSWKSRAKKWRRKKDAKAFADHHKLNVDIIKEVK